jgi:hypothetical protein
MRLFKRQAPNNMKKEDLVAKSWIITDPAADLSPRLPILLPRPADETAFARVHEPAFILYSHKIYGG